MSSSIVPWLIAGLVVAACDNNNATVLQVRNQSDFVIVDVRLTPVGNPGFGPNLLGTSVLNPGEQITLGVDCDTYDAKVIDETGAECDLTAVDLCANNAVWVLTNDECPIFTSTNGKLHPPDNAHLNQVPRR